MDHIFESLIFNYKDIKVYNIGDSQGFTGYIDFIEVNDFPENVYMMKGVDINRRPFLTLKLNVNGQYKRYSDNEEEDTEVNSDKEDNLYKDKKVKHIQYEIVVTIFQRYSDTDRPVVVGTCYPYGIFWPDTVIRNGFQMELIKLCILRINKLLQGEVINDIEYFDYDSSIGESIIPKYGLLRISINPIRNAIFKEVDEVICKCLYKDIGLVIKEYL
jgi:hypothetical protein